MDPTRPAAEVLLAACAVDGAGLHFAPAAVVLQHGVVQAVGAPEHIGSVAGAAVRYLPGTVLMPPFANAHAHLDLSRITGLQQVMREQGFWAWLDRVRTGRPNDEAGLREYGEIRFAIGIEIRGDERVGLTGGGVQHELLFLRPVPGLGASGAEDKLGVIRGVGEVSATVAIPVTDG
jgi:hypothetical protein